jgi:hypothetical protein
MFDTSKIIAIAAEMQAAGITSLELNPVPGLEIDLRIRQWNPDGMTVLERAAAPKPVFESRPEPVFESRPEPCAEVQAAKAWKKAAATVDLRPDAPVPAPNIADVAQVTHSEPRTIDVPTVAEVQQLGREVIVAKGRDAFDAVMKATGKAKVPELSDEERVVVFAKLTEIKGS